MTLKAGIVIAATAFLLAGCNTTGTAQLNGNDTLYVTVEGRPVAVTRHIGSNVPQPGETAGETAARIANGQCPGRYVILTIEEKSWIVETTFYCLGARLPADAKLPAMPTISLVPDAGAAG